jgi:hypothetical protein
MPPKFFQQRLVASQRRQMSLGMKSSVEKLYKASSVADADKALTDAVPTGKFIDEFREATACVQETSHTH